MTKSDINAVRAVSGMAGRKGEKRQIMRMIEKEDHETRESKRFNPGSSFERKGPPKGGAPGRKIPSVNSTIQT